MSEVLQATGPTLKANGLAVGWAVPIGPEAMDPLVMISDTGGTMQHMLSPDDAREIGIALIEASGLALGAWGQRQKERAEDADDAEDKP